MSKQRLTLLQKLGAKSADTISIMEIPEEKKDVLRKIRLGIYKNEADLENENIYLNKYFRDYPEALNKAISMLQAWKRKEEYKKSKEDLDR